MADELSVSRSEHWRPTPRPWYRPAITVEWGRPWWGLKRMEEITPPEWNALPARALYIGPITLIWMGPMNEEKSCQA